MAVALLPFKSAIIFLESCIFIFVSIFICLVNSLTFDIENAQLCHVVEELVADFDAFAGLQQRIFVSMDLRENCTILQLQLANYKYLSHPV